MRKLIATALALGAITSGAQAMPLAPIHSQHESNVIQVAGGCGPGWHRQGSESRLI